MSRYIEYTGWYALCIMDRTDLDHIPVLMTRKEDEVTCHSCLKKLFEEYRLKNRGLFQMLICTCTHKEHGHEHNIGACSRCECKRFVER